MDMGPERVETGLGRFVVGGEHWGGSTVDREDSAFTVKNGVSIYTGCRCIYKKRV